MIGADTGRAYLAVAAMYEEDAAFCEWIEHYFLEARDKRNPTTTTCNYFSLFSQGPCEPTHRTSATRDCRHHHGNNISACFQ